MENLTVLVICIGGFYAFAKLMNKVSPEDWIPKYVQGSHIWFKGDGSEHSVSDHAVILPLDDSDHLPEGYYKVQCDNERDHRGRPMILCIHEDTITLLKQPAHEQTATIS